MPSCFFAVAELLSTKFLSASTHHRTPPPSAVETAPERASPAWAPDTTGFEAECRRAHQQARVVTALKFWRGRGEVDAVACSEPIHH